MLNTSELKTTVCSMSTKNIIFVNDISTHSQFDVCFEREENFATDCTENVQHENYCCEEVEKPAFQSKCLRF